MGRVKHERAPDSASAAAPKPDARRYRLPSLVQAQRRQAVARVAGVGVDAVVRRALRGLFARGARDAVVPSAAALDLSFAKLSCYVAESDRLDPDRLLGPPERMPYFEVKRREPIRGGVHVDYAFASPYRPLSADYQQEFERYRGLDEAHLHGWLHDRPASGSLLLVHGWGLGTPRMAKVEFGVDFFFGRGLDVYFYVLPFHGRRRPAQARFSGELFPSANLMRTNEAFIQTVRELRTAIGFIKGRNAAPLGMMGSSLGGYTTALVASLDERLDFAVPVLPPASMAELLWEHGRGDPMRSAAEASGMTKERFADAWALHSPLRYRPKVPMSGRMIVSATGDTIVPPRFVDPLWRHWGEPEHVRFSGGHILQVFRGHYHRRVARMLVRNGVIGAGSSS